MLLLHTDGLAENYIILITISLRLCHMRRLYSRSLCSAFRSTCTSRRRAPSSIKYSKATMGRFLLTDKPERGRLTRWLATPIRLRRRESFQTLLRTSSGTSQRRRRTKSEIEDQPTRLACSQLLILSDSSFASATWRSTTRKFATYWARS